MQGAPLCALRALCETKYKIRSNLTEKIVNNQLHHDIIAIRHILLNFDSWYIMRFLIILIVLLSLLPVSLASAQSTSSVAVAQVVTKPQRVIITLRSSVGLESRNFSANQLSARRAQVRQTQTSFITRQKIRLRAIKRQMTVFPIIVADINTADYPPPKR